MSLPVIEASGDLHALLAEPCSFLLAAMRGRTEICHSDVMTIHCLLVDDNEEFLEVAGALLEREGLAIAGVASTSADALRQAERLRPDVVLVDVSLGEESGIELAKRLVADPVHDATVILISTRSEVELADLTPTSLAAGFISKSELSADTIRALLNGGGG
jgi:CheY-like chemotaxis protein